MLCDRQAGADIGPNFWRCKCSGCFFKNCCRDVVLWLELAYRVFRSEQIKWWKQVQSGFVETYLPRRLVSYFFLHIWFARSKNKNRVFKKNLFTVKKSAVFGLVGWLWFCFFFRKETPKLNLFISSGLQNRVLSKRRIYCHLLLPLSCRKTPSKSTAPGRGRSVSRRP